MAKQTPKIQVYLEVGHARTFAGAIDWPGWCRSGRGEEAALQTLLAYAPRYERVVRGTGLGFSAPADESGFAIVERLPGDATTDFGAPGAPPSSDAAPVDNAHLRRFSAVLEACWRAFDAVAKAAHGKDLRKGPRGGGREVEGIVRHLLDGDRGYLMQLGWKSVKADGDGPEQELARTRQAILDALAASARGEMAPRGPRGGLRWTPRYFVRRVAWHVLDHAWEVEDRAT
jgi:hypothetical protein